MNINRKSILLKWFISYIIILILPVLVTLQIYRYSGNNMEEEINKVNISLLQQVQRIVDSNIENIEEISMQVSLNPRIKKLSQIKDKFEQQHSFELMKAVEELNIKASYNDIVKDIIVYFKNTNSILNSKSFYPNQMVPILTKELLNISEEEFYYIMNKKNFQNIISITYSQYSECMAHLQSFPMASPKTNLGTVITIIDGKKIKNIISGIKWLNEAAVYIINDNNEILMVSNDKYKNFIISYNELQSKNNVFYKKINGEKMAVYSIKSDITDWRYVVTFPYNVFWKGAKKVKNYTFLWMGICLIIGGTIVYYFTKKNYNPIKNLITYFNDKNDNIYDNEYDYIEKCIEITLENQKQMQNKLKVQNEILKSNFIRKILKGKINSEYEIINGLLSYGIKFEYDYFAVLIFNINDFSNFANSNDTVDDFMLTQFIIKNIFEEIINLKYKCCSTEGDDLLAIIINIDTKNYKKIKTEIKCIIKEAYNQVKKYYNIDFTVAISNNHKTVHGIAEAYREALDALEYIRILGYVDMIFYEDTLKSSNKYEYSIEMEQKLINFIKIGEYDKAKDILIEVLKKNYEDYFITVEMAQCLVFDLISSMLKTIDEKDGQQFLQKLNPVKRILQESTSEGIEYELLNILKEVCAYKKEIIKMYQNDKISIKVDKFIKHNFSNYDLNISLLSEHFQISPAYLSKLYKQETGISILDNINKIRISKSKKIISDEKMTITKIANMVGYSNINVFIRIFKKYEGVTPGQYKKIIEKNG